MAGTLADRELTSRAREVGGLRFALATRADDAAIRRLLRENPMGGAISLTFEREPDYFAARNIAGEDQTILAFEGDRLICMGRCTTRPGWLNGEIKRIGYLGELRLDRAAQGRIDIVRKGYEFFRKVRHHSAADFYFTSIASDNTRARKLLERGVRGLPAYTFLTEFVTTVLPVSRRSPWRLRRSGLHYRSAVAGDFEGLSIFLSQHASRHQLAPTWSAPVLRELARVGLPAEHFQLAYDGERLVGCAALWDQRAFRQIVIRGYSAALRFLRPAINLTAPLLGGTGLPLVDSVVPHAFVYGLTIEVGYEGELAELVRALHPLAARKGIKLLTLGCAENDPRWSILRRAFSGRVYRSRLYEVSWPGEFAVRCSAVDRTFDPEVALL